VWKLHGHLPRPLRGTVVPGSRCQDPLAYGTRPWPLPFTNPGSATAYKGYSVHYSRVDVIVDVVIIAMLLYLLILLLIYY